VKEVMAAVPEKVIKSACETGLEAIRKGKPVLSNRWTEDPRKRLNLGDLRTMLRPHLPA